MRLSIPALFSGGHFDRASRYGESAAGRVKNATIIVSEFGKAGYPLGIALAAVVNAYVESDLSNLAGGDKSGGKAQSIGLFQLASFGAGRGMSVEERQDPYVNTRRIIKEVDDYGAKLMAEYNNGASVARLSYVFGRDIERPASKGVGRDDDARKLLPYVADLQANTLVKTAAAIGIIIATSVSAIAASGLVYFLWRWQNK